VNRRAGNSGTGVIGDTAAQRAFTLLRLDAGDATSDGDDSALDHRANKPPVV
jgi:hypothetical protein